MLGAASFSYNFHFLTVWDTPLSDSWGWHFQFLTIIGLSTSLAAFVFGILADLTLVPALFNAKNAIAVVATPLEVVISILYWGIRFIDPKLLIPDEEMQLGLLPDVGFHLAPAFFLTLDLVLFSPPWTIPVYAVMTLSTTLAFAYWYWVELCFNHNGWCVDGPSGLWSWDADSDQVSVSSLWPPLDVSARYALHLFRSAGDGIVVGVEMAVRQGEWL